MRNATEGVAVQRSSGPLLHTTDAGATWTPVTPPFSGPFPGMGDRVTAAVPVDGGWVCGSSRNRILVASDATLSPVPTDDEHATRWAGRDDGGHFMAAGVYLSRLLPPAGAAAVTVKLTLVK